MPLIPYPNVPQVDGVPTLARSAKSAVAGSVALGALSGVLWRVLQTRFRWGIYDSDGKALADPSLFTGMIGDAVGALGVLGDTTMSTSAVEFVKEMKVSDFPVEKGSFADYNKVEMPATPTVTLCLSGTESARADFLNAIDAATKSTDLYSVVTPEVTYANYSIDRYSYSRRQARGATLLIVELALREIRQVESTKTTVENKQVDAPKTADATPTVDAGKVQPATPKQSTLKSIFVKLGL